MSEAKVTFLDMAYEPVADPGTAARFGFACPLHKGRRCEGLLIAGGPHGRKRDGQNQNGGRAQWDWDGKLPPTFTPSVNCGGCWHGYIRAGRCVNTQGADEPEPAARSSSGSNSGRR